MPAEEIASSLRDARRRGRRRRAGLRRVRACRVAPRAPRGFGHTPLGARARRAAALRAAGRQRRRPARVAAHARAAPRARARRPPRGARPAATGARTAADGARAVGAPHATGRSTRSTASPPPHARGPARCCERLAAELAALLRRAAPRARAAVLDPARGRRRAGARAPGGARWATSATLAALDAAPRARRRTSSPRCSPSSRSRLGDRAAARRRRGHRPAGAARPPRPRARSSAACRRSASRAPARPEPFLGDDERRALNAASGLRLRAPRGRARRRALPPLRRRLAARASGCTSPGTPPTTTASRPCARVRRRRRRGSFADDPSQRRRRRDLGAVGWAGAGRRRERERAARPRPPARRRSASRSPAPLTPPRGARRAARAPRRGRRRRSRRGPACPVQVVRRAAAAPEALEPDPERDGPRRRSRTRCSSEALRPPRARERRRLLTPDAAAGRPASAVRGALDRPRGRASRCRSTRARAPRARAGAWRPTSCATSSAPRTAGSAFVPAHFEVDFGGDDDGLGPLRLAGTCALAGRIDRIDVAPGDAAEAIVYDYKGKTAYAAAKWVAEAQASRSPCTCSPRATCSTSSPSARSTSRSAPSDLRPRGALRDDADPDLAAVGDRPPRARGRSTRCSTTAVVAAPCARPRELRAGALEPRPGDLRLGRRLRVPDDLPVRGVTVAATSSGRAAPFTAEQARVGAGARATCCCSAAARQRQDVGARRALRAHVRRRRARARAGSSRSRSPRRPRASCAPASASACSSSASASGARDRGRVDLDDPRLLRAPAARPRGRRRPRPGLRRARRDDRARRCAARRGSGAFAAWLDDARRRGARPRRRVHRRPPARRRSATSTTRCARAGRRAPRLPVPPPAPAPDPAPRCCACATRAAAALARPTSARASCGGRRARPLPRGARRARRRARCPTPALLARLLQGGQHRGAQGAGVRGLPRRRTSAYAAALRRDRARRAAAAARRAARRLRDGVRRGQARALGPGLRRPRAARPRPAARGARGAPRPTRERFERVMVDEFQDSNPLQVELFDLVGDGDVFVVGDELQSIYGFRHADVEVFRAPPRRARGRAAAPPTLTHELPLAPAGPRRGQRRVRRASARASGRSSPGRADAAAGAPVVEVLLTDAEGWEDADLGGAAARAGVAPRRGAAARPAHRRPRRRRAASRPEDVVVLLRSAGDLPVYERALEEAGLQTLAAGGRGYWGRQVVRDLCAWLAALANPRDEERALRRARLAARRPVDRRARARRPRPGAGRRGRAIAERSHEPPTRLARAGRPATRALAAFRERFAPERAARAAASGSTSCCAAPSRRRDYDLHVLRLPGGARRLANVHKLLRLAAEHEREHGRDVRGLVDRATAELEADARETDAPVELGDARAVRLMTIHAAKGLEFPVVCVADLGRAARRRRRRRCSSTASASGSGCRSVAGGSEHGARLRGAARGARARRRRRGGPRPLRRADPRRRSGSSSAARCKLDPLARPEPQRRRADRLARARARSATPPSAPTTPRARPPARRARAASTRPPPSARVLRTALARARGRRAAARARRRPRAPPSRCPPRRPGRPRAVLLRAARCGSAAATASTSSACSACPRRTIRSHRAPAARAAHDRDGRPRRARCAARSPTPRSSTRATARELVTEAAAVASARVELTADELADIARPRRARSPRRRSPRASRGAGAASTASTRSAFPLGDDAAHRRRRRPRRRGRRRPRSSSTTRPTASRPATTSRRSSSATTASSSALYALAALRGGRAAASRSPTRSSSARPSRSPRVYARGRRSASRPSCSSSPPASLDGRFEVAPEPHLDLCAGCPGRRALCSLARGADRPRAAGRSAE